MYTSKRNLNYYYLMRQSIFTFNNFLKTRKIKNYTKNVVVEHTVQFCSVPLREKGERQGRMDREAKQYSGHC